MLSEGTAYFYTQPQTYTTCSHSWFYRVWDYNEGKFGFCGLCWLVSFFEGEVPSRVHEYKRLAANGNPEMAGRFFAHLEASLGLVPPSEGENLKTFRARMQYREPARESFPVSHALWKMMGYQPKLAKPLLRIMLGQPEEIVAAQFKQTRYGMQITLAKAIRLAMRYMRQK